MWILGYLSTAIAFIHVGLKTGLSAPSYDNTQSVRIKLRALNGFRSTQAGNVLIYYGGRWGTICDDGWTLQNANVTCRMLGYPRAIGHTKNAYFGIPKEGRLFRIIELDYCRFI